MRELDGFFLPGFDLAQVERWAFLEHGNVRVRWPVLTWVQLWSIADQLRERRVERLAQTPVSEIVRAIDATAEKLDSQIDDITRIVSEVTAFSPEVTRQTLAHMFADWRTPALEQMLHAELRDARVLDSPIPDPDVPGKYIAAYGFPLTVHVFSGNVPGVGVTSLIRSLIVKSATLGKTASGEPILPVLFAQTLNQIAPDIASSLAVTYWPGNDAELTAGALKHADAVVVYGGETAVQGVAQHIMSTQKLIVHGPRMSFGIIGPQHSVDTARHVAEAVAAFDQQGCVSPHVVYVVGDGARANGFAADVAQHLEAISKTHPRGKLTAGEAVAIHSLRIEAEMTAVVDAAVSPAEPSAEVYGDLDSGFSVIYENSDTFRLSCLNRVLFVKPLRRSIEEIGWLFPAAYRHQLQSAALEGFDEMTKAELIRQLGHVGVSRITTFEKLPWPPMHWHHDGSAPLRELLWWQDIEA